MMPEQLGYLDNAMKKSLKTQLGYTVETSSWLNFSLLTRFLGRQADKAHICRVFFFFFFFL